MFLIKSSKEKHLVRETAKFLTRMAHPLDMFWFRVKLFFNFKQRNAIKEAAKLLSATKELQTPHDRIVIEAKQRFKSFSEQLRYSIKKEEAAREEEWSQKQFKENN